MRGLRNAYPDIESAGGSLVAVSVDDPAASAKVVEKLRLPFPILSDPDRALLKRLGMVHPGAGPRGSDVAIPATYVVGRDGTIAWMHKSDNVRTRPNPKDVIEQVRREAGR